MKQQKGWRMSCDIGIATEGLKNDIPFHPGPIIEVDQFYFLFSLTRHVFCLVLVYNDFLGSGL